MKPAKLQWYTETRLIEDLKAHPKNPRSISKDQLDQLKESLDNFNYVEIAAVNQDGTILAGHMRIRAMVALGMDKEPIEVRVPSRPLTEKEVDEYLIRSNKNTGAFDYDILANDWNQEDLIDFGFTPQELGLDAPEELPEEKCKKGKKIKTCPSCGHEF